MGNNENLPLFGTYPAKGRVPFRVFAATIFTGICLIFVYRTRFMPAKEEEGRRAWIGLFLTEIWFTIYWFITLVVRWNPIYRHTYKDRLSRRSLSHKYVELCNISVNKSEHCASLIMKYVNRYDEKILPGIDIFVCTADPTVEPPVMVINTVLSAMAYNYPPEKMSVYLSDDGGSDLTFYALLEASRFAKHWLAFCHKFKVEPRSPDAYFRTASQPVDEESTSIKKLYEDMKTRIERTTKEGRVSEELRKQHKGFREWDLVSCKRDHQPIIQILIDGRDPKAVDSEGQRLPTLVYLAREKRPQHHHNFKAGAMNALIRVSSRISNGDIILNVDCDMYSNNSDSIRDALCFFLDEEKGHEIAFVQFPQTFQNITKNDVYSSSLRVIMQVELAGLDSNGGSCYIGTGCFHRRESLTGKTYKEATKQDGKSKNVKTKTRESVDILEEACKALATCTYEQNTQWGKEMGLKYGFPVEDIATGLGIHCKGWRSVYFCPERKGFLGAVPATLIQTLVQHKRWAEGDFQIFLSRLCPLLHGFKKIPIGLQISYCIYFLWPINCLALYYVLVPPLCLLRGISLFPEMSNPWILPFVYVFLGNRAYGLVELLLCGGTLQEWLNDQRMWVYKRTTSYLFATIDNFLKILGFTKAGFNLTAKVVDEDVSQRYEQELIEFGTSSPMYTILATIALLNAFCFVVGLKRLILVQQPLALNSFVLQTVLCGLLVFINLPIFQALFLRKDKGRMPTSVMYQSIMFTLAGCSIALY
ncbi:hypothetical protein UlMin_016560 [Ulmus minor]